jgi:hypothetical protein
LVLPFKPLELLDDWKIDQTPEKVLEKIKTLAKGN